MSNKYNKKVLLLTILFAVILIIEFLFQKIFPGWSFKTGPLIVGNKILSYISFLGLIYCLILFFKPVFEIKVVIGILFTLLLGVLSCTEIYPIDTTTQPVDVETIQVYPNGKKLVVRQYKNAKTNREIQDTVLIKDVFLFRRQYQQNK